MSTVSLELLHVKAGRVVVSFTNPLPAASGLVKLTSRVGASDKDQLFSTLAQDTQDSWGLVMYFNIVGHLRLVFRRKQQIRGFMQLPPDTPNVCFSVRSEIRTSRGNIGKLLYYVFVSHTWVINV